MSAISLSIVELMGLKSDGSRTMLEHKRQDHRTHRTKQMYDVLLGHPLWGAQRPEDRSDQKEAV